MERRPCRTRSLLKTALILARAFAHIRWMTHIIKRVRLIGRRLRCRFFCSQLGRAGFASRGNFEGFVRAASKQKWLEAHGLEHWTHFYTDYGRELQKRFFDFFLHCKDTGWSKQPKVQLQVRHIDGFVERAETDWPLMRTDWTKLYLDPTNCSLARSPPEATAFHDFSALGEGVTFLTPPLKEQIEITGPSALRIFISSSTNDADVFVILRVLSPDLKEVVFQGAIDPHTPIAQGWLRASHRKLDTVLSRPYRPYHSHNEEQKLDPGQIVQLDIEIWPTSIVIPAGFRIGLNVRGKDYEYGGASGGRRQTSKTSCEAAAHFCMTIRSTDPRTSSEV